MIMGLSYFLMFLIIAIVEEKEKKIKETMKVMGLKDTVFW